MKFYLNITKKILVFATATLFLIGYNGGGDSSNNNNKNGNNIGFLAVHAILPTAEIHVKTTGSSSSGGQGENDNNGGIMKILASQASFGTYPKMAIEESSDENDDTYEKNFRKLILPPSNNLNLCTNVTTSNTNNVVNPDSIKYGAIMLVPRGECTFEEKAMNAQLLGSSGIIIYGNLASRYSLNKTKYVNDTNWNGQYTSEDIIYPQNLYDYDCNKGKSYIPANAGLSFDPLPYNSYINDPILSGDNSLCVINSSPDNMVNCPSKSCLLTGKENEENGHHEACCAWDLHIWLYNDPIHFPKGNEIQIPAVYITMEQSKPLLNSLLNGEEIHTVIYARYRPKYNFSVILIWSLGVFVCALAAYMSASEYRNAAKHIVDENDNEVEDGTLIESASSEQQRTPLNNRTNSNISQVSSSHSSSGSNGSNRQLSSSYVSQESGEQLELGAEHACGFIIMASCGLLFLFFFKIYNLVKVMYAFGCSGAVTQILMYPLTKRIFYYLSVKDKIMYKTNFLDIGHISLYELISFILGYGLGLSWLIVAFVTNHPEQNSTFFWITQDILGTCMCIMFLSIIKLNSIRVATVLLLVAFFYDIFFVFITPYIFKGQSVMITVATSGGPPKADPAWCEKYPSDTNCQGGDPLPMLLTVPRIGDYQGGSSLLGLGDIVLPGLLLSFAARLDAAKNLIGSLSSGNSSSGFRSSQTCPPEQAKKYCFNTCLTNILCNGGYFIPLVISYGIGLSMANAAVYIMNMGQPALLYLVPCTLGTMSYLGYKRNELSALWHGPKVIKSADMIVYKDMNNNNEGQQYQPGSDGSHVPLPTTDDNDIDNISTNSSNRGDVGLPPIHLPPTVPSASD